MKTIEILVSPQGETRIETKGFAGGQCLQASESLEKALGQRTGQRLTAEFHERPAVQAAQQQRG